MIDFFNAFTFDEILFAFICSVFLTLLIRKIFSGFRIGSVKGDIQINYNPKNFKNVIKSCYDLFPKDIVSFGGDTFKRGMNVKVITNSNKVIKGQLIGINNENMICLITAKYIIAQELSQILDITPIEASGEAE